MYRPKSGASKCKTFRTKATSVHEGTTRRVSVISAKKGQVQEKIAPVELSDWDAFNEELQRIGVFDLPNPYRYNMLLMSIFCKILCQYFQKALIYRNIEHLYRVSIREEAKYEH